MAVHRLRRKFVKIGKELGEFKRNCSAFRGAAYRYHRLTGSEHGIRGYRNDGKHNGNAQAQFHCMRFRDVPRGVGKISSKEISMLKQNLRQ